MGLDFHPGMIRPYDDTGKKMTDGIHPLSQQVGDHNFQKHKELKAGVAESYGASHTRRISFCAEAWRVAELLGYENPFAGPRDGGREKCTGNRADNACIARRARMKRTK